MSIVPRPAVIHHMQHPAEAMTWKRYAHYCDAKRIDNGAQFGMSTAKYPTEIEK